MKSKLPRNIISKLEERKGENEEWTVWTFRKRLKRYITITTLHQSRNENIIRTNVNSPSLLESPQRYIGEALLSNEFSPSCKSSKCIFFDGRHWNVKCRNFPDVSMLHMLERRSLGKRM